MEDNRGPRGDQAGHEREAAADPFSSSAPALVLPKGGGAIRGMGEKFAANPVTGTGAMNVPLAVSPGRSGFGPQLALAYDSGAGNGPFGLGWSLSLPNVSRKTDKGLPRYLDAIESDVFILSGAEDLVPVLVLEDGEWQPEAVPDRTVDGEAYRIRRYRPRIEGLFARIERWTRTSDGDTHWRSISRDNVTTLYGLTAESRIADPADPRRVFRWLICQSYDDKGNAIVYRYEAENSDGVLASQVHEKNRTPESRSANRYLKRILYGNRTPNRDADWRATDSTGLSDWAFEVVLDYGEGHHEVLPLDPALAEDEQHRTVRAVVDGPASWPVRQDPFSSYRAGFEVRTYRLCCRVLMFHHFPDELETDDYLVRSTEFAYDERPVVSTLTSMVQSGYVRQEEDLYLCKSLPPLAFEYSRVPDPEELAQTPIRDVGAESLENLPYGLDGTAYRWVDLDGEGLSGILTEQAEGWFYKRNLSPANLVPEDGGERAVARFGPAERVSTRPVADLGAGTQFLDLAGDGQVDLVQTAGAARGYYERVHGRERLHEAEWISFRPFLAWPNVDTSDPNLRFVDLNGDGHADMLVTEDEVFSWYPSLAEEGYGPAQTVRQALDEERGPRLVFADGTQSIYLTDLSGDGLTDLARVRNGEVCYWPNLGYGRFGHKVAMDDAPWFDAPDGFSQARVRLADIDGSGTTDLIYLGHDGADLYFNQSGNHWSARQTLPQFPAVDSLASVQALDLLGNGTACLVWSSPLPTDGQRTMRYLDLMNGNKPHLLTKAVNNLGAGTRVRYAPSTKFYLRDVQDGKPWIMRLPFPVHVVERVETHDHVSRTRFVTRYAYHHGYFDGEEREFRGFGLVEQVDTEEFAALEAEGVLEEAENLDQSSHVPPVLTKTWFHTGVYLGRDHVSDFFAGLLDGEDEGEYYREPGLDVVQIRTLLLPDTVLPAGLTAEEEREACRALKGSMLRQEVYALDGTEAEAHPYTVREQNLSVRRLQPRNGNRHAVFITHPREALTYNYERRPGDPRVSHALTLEVDEYGNVLRSVAAGYGRRQADATLPLQADRDKQTQALLTYTENRVTNAVQADDDYRTPLVCETRTFELTGFEPENGTARYSLDEWTRDDFALLVSAEELRYEQLAHHGSTQKRLVEHVRTLYRRDDLAALLPLGTLEPLALPGESYKLALTPEHVELVYGDRVSDAMLAEEGRYVHGGGNWWIPSGRVFFSPTIDDASAQELVQARAHFFMPRRFRDPFGHTTTVDYDGHGLLLARTVDPLGNGALAENDYRVLGPRLVTDPNGNRAAVAVDALGLVVGTAVMGKETETAGDSLAGFRTDLTQAEIDAFSSDPRGPAAVELLGDATSRVIYDLSRFLRLGEPSFAATIARETHASEPPPASALRLQVGLIYSDGFGRTIQTKAQAEPGPVEEGGLDANPRWITSGWIIYNNKGQPVKQYEPFFDAGHAFRFGHQVGVSPTLLYDPPGRAVATLHPNHTYQKVALNPWRQESWDVNDTVLQADPGADPDVGAFFQRLPDKEYLPTWHSQRAGGGLGPAEQDAAVKAAAHADTPTVVHLDALGRPFLSVADNGPGGQFETRTEQDVEGNPLRVIDARGNAVVAYQVTVDDGSGATQTVTGYDVAGRGLYQESMDAGERRVLLDVAGKPIRSWDSRNQRFRTRYDELQRPAATYLQQGTDPEQLTGLTLYGEKHPQAANLNLRGQAFQAYDQAGRVTSEQVDFKGNLRRASRRLAFDYRDTVNWSGLEGLLTLDVFDLAGLEDVAAPLLEDETFVTESTYDALNRPVELQTPDGSRHRPEYNEAGLLERLTVQVRGQGAFVAFVEGVDYNEKGQRLAIRYGNGVETRYSYDAHTFRLIRLLSTRATAPATLQDLRHSYDPAGNITALQDEAQQTIFFDNQAVEPRSSYVYDPLYRLIEATGREQIGQTTDQIRTHEDVPVQPLPHPNNPQAMRRYTERYDYDPAGNILAMVHQAPGGNWTRSYDYAEESNRLLGHGGPASDYIYDPHGNMTRMPHLPSMQWDFSDQLQATSRQAVSNGGTPETTYYVYDASGQRVRKVTERQAAAGQTPTRRYERLYLGGSEIYREYGADGSTITLERETLHVMDDARRIAMVETRTQGDDGLPALTMRFQLGNHLGAATLEVDEGAAVISYEEYHPYGTSAYRAGSSEVEAALKRYRYTDKERD